MAESVFVQNTFLRVGGIDDEVEVEIILPIYYRT
jgi:hypothetical protein